MIANLSDFQKAILAVGIGVLTGVLIVAAIDGFVAAQRAPANVSDVVM